MLVTSGTVTSAAMMQARLPKGAIHQYVPLDTPGAVARFLDHWQPDAGLFVESDLWPNLILEAQARGVKLALVNARISDRSAARWRWVPSVAHALLGAFDACWRRMRKLPRVSAGWARAMCTVVGSLKADAPPLGYDHAKFAALKNAIGARPMSAGGATRCSRR